jgi:L-ectoine synthase
MKVRTIKECENTERDVNFKEGKSLRVVLAKDNMGFSIHKTIIPKGQKGHWHYKNHLESCYCIEGRGILTDLTTGEKHDIYVDTVYSLDNNDNHTFEAIEDVVLISVFNPPVTGDEVHQEDGSYKSDLANKIVESVNRTINDYDAIEVVNELLINKK